MLRRESDPADTSGGWSQVAAKAAAGIRFAPRPEAVGGKSSYVVLGRRAEKEKERREREAAERGVVESWEEEMERVQGKERGSSGEGKQGDGEGEKEGSAG